MRTALTCLNQVTGCLVLLVGLVAVGPPAADAAPITFTFAGTVSQDPLLDPDDPFGGAIGFGTPFSGSYVFESATVDGDGSANGGSYTSAGGSLTLTAGGQTFHATDLLNIGVGNNFSGSDFYTVFAQQTGGPDVFDISLLLQDLNATVLGSGLLPAAAPPFSAFELATLSLSGTVAGNQVQIDGQLTSLTCSDGCGASVPVPEPASLFLVSTALAAMRLRRRHRA
jgi:hypothetical protein